MVGRIAVTSRGLSADLSGAAKPDWRSVVGRHGTNGGYHSQPRIVFNSQFRR